jgi:hypothetical protein
MAWGPEPTGHTKRVVGAGVKRRDLDRQVCKTRVMMSISSGTAEAVKTHFYRLNGNRRHAHDRGVPPGVGAVGQ